ncbi:MAG: carboxypeptidase M32 [Spirochaetes bacterium]|nr:carboxypeptidase M32 [Spirochaetota bacterium]
MQQKMQKLKDILAEMADLKGAIAVLGWDQQTYMPNGGTEARGRQSGTLGKVEHEMATSAELGRLLDELKPYAESLDPDSNDARMIKVAARDFDLATRVPSDFVVEQAQITAMANQAWAEARSKADFSIFQPHLEKIVDLTHRYVGFFPPADHPYDVLLDIYEPEMKTADVKKIFNELRPKQVELIKAISRKTRIDNSFLYQSFDEKNQWDFGIDVITRLGYDMNRGRQDKSEHPFTTGFSLNDVRITTRVESDFLSTMIFGSIHEAGHAMYAQGHSPELERTNLADGASLAIHESQSRMWENLVGRSLPFWEFFYQKLQEKFPQLNLVTLDNFYKGINKVEPSPVRIEADEATYNLHIMLRLELEIGIIEGKIQVKDLPEIWNAKMKEYLGIEPENDALGVLQDVHWSWGAFGYFSTYALGNLISAQLWENINQDIPDLSEQISSGKFDDLLSWLRKNIHSHGRKFMPQELVKKVTGSEIDPAPYLRYLKDKFGKIYGL